MFAGSALWWLFLSSLTGALRSRLDATWSRRVNLASAVAVISFGLMAVVSALTPA